MNGYLPYFLASTKEGQAQLLGIDSVLQPYEQRLRAWQRIATDLPLEKLEALIRPTTLAEVPTLGAEILKGRIKGRIVVDVNA